MFIYRIRENNRSTYYKDSLEAAGALGTAFTGIKDIKFASVDVICMEVDPATWNLVCDEKDKVPE